MACRCVVFFDREARGDKGNHETFHSRLTDFFNMDDKNGVVIKASRTGNFFFHYVGDAMPQDHIERLMKINGQVKSTHQERFAF